MKSKLLLGLIFAGVASAQYTCSNPSSASSLLRAEGTTEQTADLVITCTTSAIAPATLAGAANLALSVSPSLPITSKVLATSGTPYTEAVALTTTTLTQGYVTGTGAMLFQNIPTPACLAATVCTFNITVSNVRVNVTSLGAGPVSISESALITAAGFPATVNPVLVPNTVVGIVLNGLTATSTTNLATAASACSGTGTTPVPFFTLNFGENFSTAFKTQGSAAADGIIGAWTEPVLNTETGYVPAGFANIAANGTRLKVTFNNVPTGMTIYVPLSVLSTVGAGSTSGSIVLTASETGAFSPVTGNGALQVTNGVATAIYEVTAQANGASQVDNYSIPVTYTLDAGAVTNAVLPPTATVQFATSSFVVGSSTNTVIGPGVNICNTVLLFPYVTNDIGFDTGIAIANTSSDTQKTMHQSGTCAMNFYGTAAPKAVVATPSVATGTVYAATLSSLAPGFTGYAIANCNFQYAYGFAYISFDLTQGNGVSMGYLSIIINSQSR